MTEGPNTPAVPDDVIERLDALFANATPGEWQANGSHVYGGEPHRTLIAQVISPWCVADRDAIIALHNAWPMLRATLTSAEMRVVREDGGVLAEVAAERERQIAKGYDAAHDDEHSDGMIGLQAAAALVLPKAGEGPRWISRDQPRRDQLIQGIALAVAEVERMDRATPPASPESAS